MQKMYSRNNDLLFDNVPRTQNYWGLFLSLCMYVCIMYVSKYVCMYMCVCVHKHSTFLQNWIIGMEFFLVNTPEYSNMRSENIVLLSLPIEKILADTEKENIINVE